MRPSKNIRKDSGETKSNDIDLGTSVKLQAEKQFQGFSHGTKLLEVYQIRPLLLSFGFDISKEKEKELLTKFKMNPADSIDFEMFYTLLNFLKTERESADKESLSSEYLDAFIALGGAPGGSGTITKDKIVSVLLKDFEMTLDIDKYMQILGEEVKDVNFEQFCTLLNETRQVNPSRFSNFLEKRHMSGAIQFFNQLDEAEGNIVLDDVETKEMMADFEGEEKKA